VRQHTPRTAILGEIASQGEVWAELIPLVTGRAAEIRQRVAGVDEVVFTGCGSGLNAAVFGAAVFQMQTGIAARAVPAADIYLLRRSVLLPGRRTLVVLASRSGRTTEIVTALDYLRGQGIPTIGVTCTPDSPLATRSDLFLPLTPAAEQAVATTRSLTAMMLTCQLLAAIVSGDEAYLRELYRLPEACQAQMKDSRRLGKVIGQRTDLTKYAFVGNGPFFGLAREAQLKVKETALLPADGYPLLDFRHGPQSNVDGQMLIVAFISDSAYREELQFLRDMKALGGVTWALCDRADEGLLQSADYVLELESGLGELARAVLYLPAVQYMACYRSLSLGLSPDKPRNLSYWIDTSHH
jgi:glucosamine--fructose-6-phosphate aminotransferase (isomerizing)